MNFFSFFNFLLLIMLESYLVILKTTRFLLMSKSLISFTICLILSLCILTNGLLNFPSYCKSIPFLMLALRFPKRFCILRSSNSSSRSLSHYTSKSSMISFDSFMFNLLMPLLRLEAFILDVNSF